MHPFVPVPGLPGVFSVHPDFARVVELLDMYEWSPVVWLGRLLLMDEDFGEHIFDAWDERDALRPKIAELGLGRLLGDYGEFALIVRPEVFVGRRDGPCNTNAARFAFWADVLSSLSLSAATMLECARSHHRRDAQDLARIEAIAREAGSDVTWGRLAEIAASRPASEDDDDDAEESSEG